MRRTVLPRRGLVLLLAVLFATAFAYLNSGERIALHLGFAVLYQVPLVGVVFGVYLLGMASMYLLGLRHDMRVRRLLREHGLDVPIEEEDAPAPTPPPPPDPYP